MRQYDTCFPSASVTMDGAHSYGISKNSKISKNLFLRKADGGQD